MTSIDDRKERVFDQVRKPASIAGALEGSQLDAHVEYAIGFQVGDVSADGCREVLRRNMQQADACPDAVVFASWLVFIE